MHIGILATWEMPISQPFAGGTEAFTSHLVSYLNKNHTITVFAHPDSIFDNDINFIPYPNILTDILLELKKNPKKNDDHCKNIDVQYAMLELEKLGCDVIHNHSFSEIPIMYQDTVLTPIVTTFHLSTDLIGYLHGVVGYGIQNPTGGNYVCVSKNSSEGRSKYTNNVTTIPNGIDTTKRTYTSKPDSDNYYSRVGRICKNKGAHEAIKIAIEAGVQLRLAGRITEKSYFKTKILPFLSDQIQYVGELNQGGINELIGKSAGLLFTSLCQEAFGLVVVEALASGAPVFAYAAGASPEIILPDVGVVVPQKDYKSLALAIQTQTFDRAACRKHVEDHYSYEVMIQQYLELYLRVIKDKK